MPDSLPPDSVGIVASKSMRFDQPLQLECGKSLPEYDIAYETYGELNPGGSNAILICHALSGDAHAAGIHDPHDKRVGWWDNMIGPGKVFDTNQFFVLCSNVLGSCKGSTGPNTINPATGKPYGSDFPLITIGDMVAAQKQLVDHLGIEDRLGMRFDILDQRLDEVLRLAAGGGDEDPIALADAGGAVDLRPAV